jgi:uncharacterized CHY-type Zn-finger protein
MFRNGASSSPKEGSVFLYWRSVRVRFRVTLRQAVYRQSESESELLYDWRFPADQFVLATRPLRLATSNFIFQLNTCGYCPYVTSSLTRGWVSFTIEAQYRPSVCLGDKLLGTHEPHKKHRFQQLFHYYMCIRCRGSVFTEPLPTNSRLLSLILHVTILCTVKSTALTSVEIFSCLNCDWSDFGLYVCVNTHTQTDFAFQDYIFGSTVLWQNIYQCVKFQFRVLSWGGLKMRLSCTSFQQFWTKEFSTLYFSITGWQNVTNQYRLL